LAELAALLAPAAIGLLPLPPETVRRLERLGLRTLGDLAALPPAAVQARFGAQGRRMWELASGRDDTPVTPRRRPETVSEWLDLPAPAISREAFLFALRRLVLTAIAQPTLRGRAARQARVRVFLESGGVWEKEVTLREPAAGERLSEALRLRFGAVSLPGPVVSLALALSGLTAEAARQATIAGAFPRRPNALAEAAQQLAARYGASPLYRIVEVEPWSRIPERRHALIAFEP
ncbi:MAG TPA: hypothetical protein VFU81_00610, partial [Thermomicrobiales bacterium]|nr:hypothetical protein [Thermomicrobiales bacterium]